MATRAELDLSSYDRFFPSQDFLPNGAFGNLIALPLHGDRLRARLHALFLDPDDDGALARPVGVPVLVAWLAPDAGPPSLRSLRPVDAGPALTPRRSRPEPADHLPPGSSGHSSARCCRSRAGSTTSADRPLNISGRSTTRSSTRNNGCGSPPGTPRGSSAATARTSNGSTFHAVSTEQVDRSHPQSRQPVDMTDDRPEPAAHRFQVRR